jgi:hypothetical protein
MKSTSLTAKGKGLTGLVVAASAIAAVGGILFGFDTGVISGAILFIAKQWSPRLSSPSSVVDERKWVKWVTWVIHYVPRARARVVALRTADRERDREGGGREARRWQPHSCRGSAEWFSLICVRGKQHEISAGTPDHRTSRCICEGHETSAEH